MELVKTKGCCKMNLISLWMRVLSLFLIMCLLIAFSYVFLKKFSCLRWLAPLAFVLFFGLSIFKVSSAIVNPSVETFVGTYVGFEKEATSINFFSLEYCFEVEGEKIYVDVDAVSANILYPSGLEVGQTYVVSYETKENLIIEIAKHKEGLS